MGKFYARVRGHPHGTRDDHSHAFMQAACSGRLQAHFLSLVYTRQIEKNECYIQYQARKDPWDQFYKTLALFILKSNVLA